MFIVVCIGPDPMGSGQLSIHYFCQFFNIMFVFDSDFPSSCFDVPKATNFTSGGVQNRETKNRRLGAIVTSFQDFKLCENVISDE